MICGASMGRNEILRRFVVERVYSTAISPSDRQLIYSGESHDSLSLSVCFSAQEFAKTETTIPRRIVVTRTSACLYLAEILEFETVLKSILLLYAIVSHIKDSKMI